MPNNDTLDDIVTALRNAGIPRKGLTKKSYRLILELLRLIAEGTPVARNQIEEIADKLQISPEETDEFLNMATEKNDNGYILGTFGLTQKRYSHRLQVDGQQLSTWCAWDTLFLPGLLNKTVNIESNCPVTNEKIQLIVSPEQLERYSPESAVISIVLPPKEAKTVADVYQMFCHHVYFFQSSKVLEEWSTGESLELMKLSVEDGFELGRRVFRDLNNYARAYKAGKLFE